MGKIYAPNPAIARLPVGQPGARADADEAGPPCGAVSTAVHGRMLRLLAASVLLLAFTACNNDSCETSVDEPTCEDGFEPVAADYVCANEIGVSEWICVAEDIGTPCDANGPVDVCGSDLLCVTEPGASDAIAGTCLPLCTAVDGDCTVLGEGWECVTTSNGPDVCAVDYAN